MRGLYVHIPFCRQKCRYCDFVSRPAGEETITAYLGVLIKEMRLYRGAPVETVFLGGGTPSLLSAEHLKTFFSALRENFNCPLTEITVEANPESLDEDKLRVMKLAGVNRLSLGVQSFSNAELQLLGRVHSVETFRQAFVRARRFNFSNISIDLMYGLPGQSLNDWKKNLTEAVYCHTEHISLYPLTVEPGTPFAETGVKVDEAAQADMYEWTMDYLEGEGYEHYEISNWARPGYRCRHNQIYWQNQEYIGLGAAAASYIGRRRRRNCSDIDEYIRRVHAGEELAEECEEIDDAKYLSEELILKLRCSGGLPLTERMTQEYGSAIKRFTDEKLLERSGANIRLTRRGKLLANRVFEEFV